jgi:hypothetical protein
MKTKSKAEKVLVVESRVKEGWACPELIELEVKAKVVIVRNYPHDVWLVKQRLLSGEKLIRYMKDNIGGPRFGATFELYDAAKHDPMLAEAEEERMREAYYEEFGSVLLQSRVLGGEFGEEFGEALWHSRAILDSYLGRCS